MTRRNSPADPSPRVRRALLRADFDHVADDHALWRDDDAHDDRRAALLREAVATALTARQRDIVEWHFFEGISQGDIARRLGVSQQVVQKAIYGVTRNGRAVGGALRRLREVLAAPMGAEV